MFGADGGAEDLHDEYLQATLKKAGLPVDIDITKMEIEHGIKDTEGNVWLLSSRAEAESAAEADDLVVVREVIHTEWRTVTPHGSGA